MTPKTTELPARWATPAVLEWARKRLGLGIEEAARRANSHSEVLKGWESGGRLPSLDDLETLADVYDCPVGFFFLEGPPVEPPLGLDFRGLDPNKPDRLGYETQRGLREFRRLVDYAGELIEALGLRWDTTIPVVPDTSRGEDAAARVREAFPTPAPPGPAGISPHGLFQAWRDAIESQGVIVVTLRLEPGEVRGASTWNPPDPPAILVNRQDIESATGRIFTLLHEYAHLLARSPAIVCDFRGTDAAGAERFANCVAAELVLPRARFSALLASRDLSEFRQIWSDDLLDELRTPFAASRDATAIRLEELGLAPPGFYRRKRAAWDERKPFGRGGRGGGQKKIDRARGRLGTNMLWLLAQADARGAVPKTEIAEILEMKTERADPLLQEIGRQRR